MEKKNEIFEVPIKKKILKIQETKDQEVLRKTKELPKGWSCEESEDDSDFEAEVEDA